MILHLDLPKNLTLNPNWNIVVSVVLIYDQTPSPIPLIVVLMYDQTTQPPRPLSFPLGAKKDKKR